MSGTEALLLIMFLYQDGDQHVPELFRILFFRFSYSKNLNFINTGQTDIAISPGFHILNLEKD